MTDFDLPVTEEFLTRVRRGVLRRRLFRAAAVSCVVLVASGTTVAVWPRPSTGPAPAAIGTVAAVADVDIYHIGYVPAGISVDPFRGSNPLAVAKDGTVHERKAQRTDEADVAVSMRRFRQANGGSWLWITVLRPVSVPSGMALASVTDRLVDRHMAGAETVSILDVPAGAACLTRTAGGEADGYGMVIKAADGTVITLEANTKVTADELRAVAVGLTPA